MARIGRLRVSCNFNDGSDLYIETYRITEVEIEGVLFVGHSNDASCQNSVTWFDDVDISNTSHLDSVFRFGGTNTYTWLTPMTEVPDDEVGIEYPISISNGGTGATTAEQALENLGAASAIALDRLSDIVDSKVDANHEHLEYATTSAVAVLQDIVNDKANSNHVHTEYASALHTHDNYALVSDLNSLSNVVAGKAASSHNHAIADIVNLQSELDAMSDSITSKADENHGHSNYSLTTHNHDGVYAEASHTHNYAASNHGHSVATTAVDGFMSATDKTKLSGIATGAEVNQNAFSNVVVGSTTIAADAKMDTLTLVAGSNVTITPDATNDKITISATDTNTVYTHPTTSGNKHIPAGGSSGQILRWSADGTAVWGADNNTTYSAATTSAAGLMSAADKTKLNGIATGANAYTLPTAGSSLGGVKTTSTVTSTSGLTACPIISGVPYYKDTNTTYSLGSFGITATAAELNYCDGVTSNIQTQLNGKAASSHTHSYLPLSGGTVNGETNIAGVLKVQGQQAFNYSTSTNSQTIGTNNATGGTTICCGASADVGINGTNLRTSNILPKTNNASYCGNANFRWKGIYSAANVNVSSDERLKENIEPVNVDEAVKLINDIDIKSFNYIGDDRLCIGVIAQDIIEVSPEMSKFIVEQDEDGYYGVKTSDLVFPLIATVQKLTKEIEELKSKIS